jgi:hypothetical protein
VGDEAGRRRRVIGHNVLTLTTRNLTRPDIGSSWVFRVV